MPEKHIIFFDFVGYPHPRIYIPNEEWDRVYASKSEKLHPNDFKSIKHPLKLITTHLRELDGQDHF